MPDALILSLAIVSSSLLVCGAVALLLFGFVPRPGKAPAMQDVSEQDAVFVFREEDLVDSSDRGRQLLSSIMAASPNKAPELDHLLKYLEPRFTDLRQDLRDLVSRGTLELQSHDDSGLVLHAARKNGLTHLRLVDTRAEGALVALDRLSFEAMRDELDTLRDVVGHVPVLSWRVDDAGRVIWANAAYIDAYLAVDAGRMGLTWPLPNLFGDAKPDEHSRLSLEMPDHVAWFCHAQAPDASGQLHFATPIDLTVQTETSRREMMQVLTRTFASLPTGLALFDRDRRLQVFNPALVDLMGLDPLFLAARPSLEQFLYTLRELRMLPEPKDFATWRNDMAEMEHAAQIGSFSEEWCLDTGRIFQVSGRPQPGGALAFFFEDVTSDAALVRNLRAEIEIGQAVFDGLQDAVVVFNGAGDTLLSNDRYSQIWGENPCNDLADTGFRHAVALWARTSATTQFWSELTQLAEMSDRQRVLTGTVCLMDGTTLGVHARWLRQECLMITFRPLVQGKSRENSANLGLAHASAQRQGDQPARSVTQMRAHAQALAAPDLLTETSAAQMRRPKSLAPSAGLEKDGSEHPAPSAASRKSRVVHHAGSRSRA
ncbi:MAG: hypothetical protein GVY34_01250 [Alphaproteobacteria bacterium]|jgi:PAS domain-containing protein|nr:hypothetical protein [Alphaproteobacteria bacterium]